MALDPKSIQFLAQIFFDKLQEPGRLEPEVDNQKDMGTVRRGSCDSVVMSSSVKLNPESYCGVGQSGIATAAAILELDTLNSSVFVKSHGTVDNNLKKMRDQKESSVVQLNDTASLFKRHGDKALSVPSSRRDYIKEADCHSSKGASDNDQTKGEIFPSEDTRNQTIEESHSSVGKLLRKSFKHRHSIAVSETKLVDLSLKETDKTEKPIDSEAEKLFQTTTRRSIRSSVERKLLEQNKFINKQHTRNSILKKDLAREKISKKFEVAELVDVPPKRTDKTIDSEGKDVFRTNIKRSIRKATEMESLEHQKSKIEKLIGKFAIIDDLAGQQSSKEGRIRSRTKFRRKCTRAIKEVSEAEPREKEVDEALVGSKIEVWWPDDKEFYEGVVESFDPISKKHKVSYFDGDEEILFLRDERWKFLKADAKLLKADAKPEFVWRQQKENPRADASPNVLNVGKGKDPTWEHCSKLAGNPRWKLKCKHCLKMVPGITRMKYHLARANKISLPCSSCPKEVEEFFSNMISQ